MEPTSKRTCRLHLNRPGSGESRKVLQKSSRMITKSFVCNFRFMMRYTLTAELDPENSTKKLQLWAGPRLQATFSQPQAPQHGRHYDRPPAISHVNRFDRNHAEFGKTDQCSDRKRELSMPHDLF